MKKLIIVACAIAVAAVSQAATISWTSGALKTPASADGGWSSTAVTSGSVAAYLFVIDSATYDSLLSSDVATLSANVYNQYKDNLGSADATKSTGATIQLNDGVSTYGAGSEQYAALLYILTDGDSQYYIGNVGHVALTSASNKNTSNMALNVGGTGGASMTAVGWTAAVPEPTSGLLLLLGMAGLALRRKQA